VRVPVVVSKDLARKVMAALHGTDRSPNVFHPMYAFVRAHHRTLHRARAAIRGLCVDVGCGDRFFEAFYRGAYTRYVGIDYLPADSIREVGIASERRRGIDFHDPDVIADGRTLPLGTAIADTVLLIEVLEHVPDPGRLLTELARVLKPGGHLLLTTPFALPEHAQPYDFYRYTQFGLRHLIEAAGLRVGNIEQVTSLGGVVSFFINMFPVVGTFRGGWLSRMVKLLCAPVFLLLWGVMNTWALVWDRMFPKDGFTLDYFVIAEKP